MNARSSLSLLHPDLERRAAPFVKAGALNKGALLIVDTVAARFPHAEVDALLALAFATQAPEDGHLGVVLNTLPQRFSSSTLRERRARRNKAALDVEEASLPWPAPLSEWETKTLHCPLVGEDDDDTPFVAQQLHHGETLFLSRQLWSRQVSLANQLHALSNSEPAFTVDDATLQTFLEQEVGDLKSSAARAISRAGQARLTIITGGPGSGKTYSVTRLAALLLQAASTRPSSDEEPLRVALAAPTGKAAVRMAEAIAEGAPALKVSAQIRDALTKLTPQTLHKLLGIAPNGRCRHHPRNPLSADVVIVDEASMVGLVLMERLVSALGDGTRLVLLGDRDQLASVDAGSVLADMVGPALTHKSKEGNPKLRDAIIPFRENHRMKDAPELAALVERFRADDDDGVQEALTQGGPSVRYLGNPSERAERPALLNALAAPYLNESGYVGQLASAFAKAKGDLSALEGQAFWLQMLRSFDQYRVLAVHRKGALGVEALARDMETRSVQALEHAGRRVPRQLDYWLGQPVLVTENAYREGVMNGDVGLVLPVHGQGLAAVFASTLGGQATTKSVPLARLPRVESAFVMTVHKSQGSQFERVAVVLADKEASLQTRELIYTALTRARSRLDWLGDKEALRAALQRRVERSSGLRELLWEPKRS